MRVTAVDGRGRARRASSQSVLRPAAVGGAARRGAAARPGSRSSVARARPPPRRHERRSTSRTSRTGRGAAWNARRRFPAASTLKLAIAVTVLRCARRACRRPERGSTRCSATMLVRSDNDAANALEVWLGGSTSPARPASTRRCARSASNDSLMYGGYERTRRPAAAAARSRSAPRAARRSASASTRPPGISPASPARSTSPQRGRARCCALGVTGSEARHLLWLLAQVTDRGKLGRFFAPGVSVLHKAGWLATARHDNGIVDLGGRRLRRGRDDLELARRRHVRGRPRRARRRASR